VAHYAPHVEVWIFCGRVYSRPAQEVEKAGARVVVIDTLSGYNSAMMDDKYLTTQLHEFDLLSHRSVTTMWSWNSTAFLAPTRPN